MTVKLLTEHHLECLSLTGGCTGSSESTHVKMPHCSKSHVTAHMHLLRGEAVFYIIETKEIQMKWKDLEIVLRLNPQLKDVPLSTLLWIK